MKCFVYVTEADVAVDILSIVVTLERVLLVFPVCLCVLTFCLLKETN